MERGVPWAVTPAAGAGSECAPSSTSSAGGMHLKRLLGASAPDAAPWRGGLMDGWPVRWLRGAPGLREVCAFAYHSKTLSMSYHSKTLVSICFSHKPP